MANEPFVGAGTYPITPSDTVDLLYPGVVIQCDAGGAVKVTGENGMVDTVTLLSGVSSTFKVRRVWATGTTATGIHGILS